MTNKIVTKMLLQPEYADNVQEHNLGDYVLESQLPDFVDARVFALDTNDDYTEVGTVSSIKYLPDTEEVEVTVDGKVAKTDIDEFDFDFEIDKDGTIVGRFVYVMEFIEDFFFDVEPVIEVKQENKTEVVPFEQEEVEDPKMYFGNFEITQVGVNGERTIVEDVTYIDGVETGRVETSNTVTTEPVTEITSKGTKPPE